MFEQVYRARADDEFGIWKVAGCPHMVPMDMAEDYIVDIMSWIYSARSQAVCYIRSGYDGLALGYVCLLCWGVFCEIALKTEVENKLR